MFTLDVPTVKVISLLATGDDDLLVPLTLMSPKSTAPYFLLIVTLVLPKKNLFPLPV